MGMQMFIEIGKDIVNFDHIRVVEPTNIKYDLVSVNGNADNVLAVEFSCDIVFYSIREHYTLSVTSETREWYQEPCGNNYLPRILGPNVPVVSASVFYKDTEMPPTKAEIGVVLIKNVNTWVRQYINCYLEHQHNTGAWRSSDPTVQ